MAKKTVLLRAIVLMVSIGCAQETRIPPRPNEPPDKWKSLIGEYIAAGDTVIVRESAGTLETGASGRTFVRLVPNPDGTYSPPQKAGSSVEAFEFTKAGPRAGDLRIGDRRLPKRSMGEGNKSFQIVPLHPAAELRASALTAKPPVEQGEFLMSDLVDVTTLDTTIHLDIRYASTNNFIGEKFYSSARAFLQRPAAEGLVRAHRWLRQFGYGILVHDGYRPWYVTKMFWDATPDDKKLFVADPAKGSRHNRGCAADISLYVLATGAPAEMISGYDEMSERAYPEFAGGTSLQRWHRDLLRSAMEQNRFRVYEWEWWHFDYEDWRRYPIGTKTFEELSR